VENQHNSQSFVRKTFIEPIHQWLDRQWEKNRARPANGEVDFGILRRLKPISYQFGYDRDGGPIDRYYIEQFLAKKASDIQGRVLEIGDDSYTKQFGGDRTTKRDVLHVDSNNPLATFVGDLTHADNIPSDTFDCFILTQTLHLVYDARTALKTIYRILKPGGVVLATFPGISQIANDQWAKYWHWSFTKLSAQTMFGECFPDSHIEIETCGNVLVAISFLQGLGAKELTEEELNFRDELYEVLITVRAQKPEVNL
jgi:SAM-dependent methyltransferase